MLLPYYITNMYVYIMSLFGCLFCKEGNKEDEKRKTNVLHNASFVRKYYRKRKENGLSDFTNINKTINPVFC